PVQPPPHHARPDRDPERDGRPPRGGDPVAGGVAGAYLDREVLVDPHCHRRGADQRHAGEAPADRDDAGSEDGAGRDRASGGAARRHRADGEPHGKDEDVGLVHEPVDTSSPETASARTVTPRTTQKFIMRPRNWQGWRRPYGP